ncbi:MAG: hypothetical protein AAFX10_16650 [Pseudomonadota bacterium]
MYRLLGFCLGSAASVSALMFLIGWPDFHLSGDESDADRYDVAVQKLKAKRKATETVDAEAAIAPPEDAEVATAAVESTAILPENPDTSADADTGPLEPERSPPQLLTTDDGVSDVAPVETWHTIWTPFRSRIAADGFVSRLESVTGLDYRVLQVQTGVYEVAFAYADQAELDTNLARISAATGLDLGADRP